MLKISANQNLPDGSLGHGNPLEQTWWYTKSWWHLAKFTAWVMPPCLAHWACLALCLASCTLSWPHLHMAWGRACYQWPGMTPLAVDECVMKESCLALTMGAPPACPGCCEKHPTPCLCSSLILPRLWWSSSSLQSSRLGQPPPYSSTERALPCRLSHGRISSAAYGSSLASASNGWGCRSHACSSTSAHTWWQPS